MTLEKKLGENFSDNIIQEYCLTHALYGNTAECRVFVEIQDFDGNIWVGERVIKMRLKKTRKSTPKAKKIKKQETQSFKYHRGKAKK